MDDSKNIGGAPLLVVICLVVFALFRCSVADESPKIAPSYSASAPVPPAPQKRPETDLTKPLQTSSYAVVCHQGILLEAIASRAAVGAMDRVYDAFTSVFNHSRKVKEAGCEEWRGGVRIYDAQRLHPPLQDFIGFGLSANGISEYFTMKSHLVNGGTAAPAPPTGRQPNIDQPEKSEEGAPQSPPLVEVQDRPPTGRIEPSR